MGLANRWHLGRWESRRGRVVGGILRWTDGESGCSSSSSIADKREMPEADWRNQTSSLSSLSPAGDNYILLPTQVYLKLKEDKRKIWWYQVLLDDVCPGNLSFWEPCTLLLLCLGSTIFYWRSRKLGGPPITLPFFDIPLL